MKTFKDDTVRIELGPQLIELDATDANLADEVTAPHYHEGAIDALGKRIFKGQKMTCVDWRAKHVPHVHKVYQHDGKRFQLVDEYENEDEAIAFAEGL